MCNDRGFSLPEALVSMLILMVATLVLAHSTAMAVVANHRTRIETTAANYAQEKVEYLKIVPFQDANLSVGTHSETVGNGFGLDWVVTLDGSGTRKTIEVSIEKDLPGALQSVAMTVVIVRSQ